MLRIFLTILRNTNAIDRMHTVQNRYHFSQFKYQMSNQNAKEYLTNFPYTVRLHGNFYNVQEAANQSSFINKNIVKSIIAYNSLVQHNPRTLRRNYETLFKNEPVPNHLQGPDIFQKLFSNSIQDMSKVLKNSTSEQQITYTLKTIFYLSRSKNFEQYLAKLDFTRILSKGTLSQKAYLFQILEKDPKFLYRVQKFIQQFEDASNQQKLKAAFVIISIQSFDKKLPHTLCEQSIKLIATQAFTLKEWQAIKVLKNCYESKLPSVKILLQQFMKSLFKNNEQSFSISIPLFVKILKMRSAFKMDNTLMQNYIKNNSQKFSTVFVKKNQSRHKLMETVATKNQMRLLPQQIKVQFIQYTINELKLIIKMNQCEPSQVEKLIKNALKFYTNFSQNDLNAIKTMLFEKLIPMFEEEPQVCFWFFVLLLRIDKQMLLKPSFSQMMKNIKAHFHQQYLKSNDRFQKQEHLKKIIEINYQFLRNNLPVQIQKLLEYDFSLIKLLQPMIYICNIVIKSTGTPKQKYKVLSQILNNFQNQLNQNNNRSLKNIFTFVDALSKCKCDQAQSNPKLHFIFKKIQNNFINIVSQMKSIPKKEDLMMMKRAFSEQRIPSSSDSNTIHNYHFVKFLEACLANPQQFAKHLQNYKNGARPNKSKSQRQKSIKN